jgi:hypothetical protein
MSFGSLAHVAKIVVGENNDVKNLSNMLFTPNNLSQSAKNFQAFDMMTSAKRGKLLYDSNLLYDDNGDNFHFDNAGVHGDIITIYNAVVTTWGGTGGSWGTDGTWIGPEDAYTTGTVLNSFWIHWHPGRVDYYDEILGTSETDGPSYLLGHRDNIGTGFSAASGWTADDMPGRSLILDETLLYFLAGRGALASSILPGSHGDSYGYATRGTVKDSRHFREALAQFIRQNPLSAEITSGLSIPELLAGYTRDGTLMVFSNGDIFSGNIYGGGLGDPLVNDQYVLTNFSGSTSSERSVLGMFGNIDLRFVDGTTIFNRNIIEIVDGSGIYQYAGIRVRDVYVEKTGHLLLNNAEFAVNPFHPVASFAADYADRLIIHDVLNEGIVSGNGVFQIAERWHNNSHTRYFDGYFINRGILAPGLPGFIGESEWQARELEKTAYSDMLKTVSQSSGDMLYQQLMRGVPGGQFGTIEVFGSLMLMDEHIRPNYNPYSPFFNTDETLAAGEYHVTISNDTLADMFGKYVASIAGATSAYRTETRYDGTVAHVYDNGLVPEGEISREDWKIIAVEKLGTHLSWFSPSSFIDNKTGLPLLTQYEQFEYLTDATRRAELQRQLLEAVLTPQELRQYDTNPAERARLNRKMLEANNVQFEFTHLDQLLWRFGFSDVVSVHGTIPPYMSSRYAWSNSLYNIGSVPPSNITNNPDFVGITQLGGVIQADRIYDMDANADSKEKLTSYIIIASEGYTHDGSIKTVTSSTTDWVFANVDVLPLKMASGQSPAVLTVIDDPNYYSNRIRSTGEHSGIQTLSTTQNSRRSKTSYNALSVAGALDNAMFTNPGLAMSFQFGLNSQDVLHDVFRQVASSTRANSIIMNLSSPSDHLFNHIGYGTGGLSTGSRGDVVFRNIQTGRLEQPFGQPAVPPPGQQHRGQSPFYRTGSVWGAYTHSTFSMGDDDNSFKYTFHRNGAMVGNEWNLTPSSVIGGVAMFNEGTLKSLSDEVKSHDYTFGVYLVAAPFEQFEVKSFLGGGFQSYKTDRYIRNSEVFIGGNSSGSIYGQGDIFGINDKYDSEARGYSFNYTIEFARPFTVSPNFVIRPVAGFEYQNILQRGYSERMNEGSRISWSNNGSNIADGHETQGATRGTYGMDYKEMSFGRTLSRFGVNTESYFARGGMRFRAYHIGRLTGDRRPVSEQSFTSGSQLFDVRGGDLGTSYCQIGFGSHLWLNRERTATFFMNGDWNFSLHNRGYNMLNLSVGGQLSF